MNNRKLIEAVADIAYEAGRRNFYTGDSRADISEFIRWAEQFELENECTDWGSNDYLSLIESFADLKIKKCFKLDFAERIFEGNQ